MIRVVELFAGIGSQTQALKNISVAHEVVAISEIDTSGQQYRGGRPHGDIRGIIP